MEGQYIPDIEPLRIDINGVVELLKNLKPHKAFGPDEIPAYLLKETSKEITPVLTFTFQASLQQSSIPSDWKKATVVPLFKKGDRALFKNLRTYYIFTHFHSSDLIQHLM